MSDIYRPKGSLWMHIVAFLSQSLFVLRQLLWKLSGVKAELPNDCAVGLRAIVTGGNSGIGLETARLLLRAGAEEVILACRNPAKADQAVADLESSVKRKGAVRAMQLDVSDPSSVTCFVNALGRRGERVDVLVNNAGILFAPPSAADRGGGFCPVQRTNFLGPVSLSVALRPLLEQSGGRIVFVGSMTHPCGMTLKEGFDPRPSHGAPDGIFAYYTSKLSAITAAMALAARWDECDASGTSGAPRVKCVVADPGIAFTNIAHSLPQVVQWLYAAVARPFLIEADLAALTVSLAAAGKHDPWGSANGEYFVMGAPGPCASQARARRSEMDTFLDTTLAWAKDAGYKY